jgi:mono/diheme cytochrome c family protein
MLLQFGVIPVMSFTAAMALAGETGPAPLDVNGIEAGRKIYQQYCASCHGPRGKLNGDWEQPNAEGELPPPPHDAEGHTWKHSDAVLYRMVREGWRDPFNKTKRLTMPAFGDQLSPRQVCDVIAYLKTLWSPEQREFQREETQVRGAFPRACEAPPGQPRTEEK